MCNLSTENLKTFEYQIVILPQSDEHKFRDKIVKYWPTVNHLINSKKLSGQKYEFYSGCKETTILKIS